MKKFTLYLSVPYYVSLTKTRLCDVYHKKSPSIPREAFLEKSTWRGAIVPWGDPQSIVAAVAFHT
ncbi:hypothetical protein, partial [Chroococcidiopsis sp. CCALA 051]|uniref:hypothetical protein n=1 Tax=Chroococcidiopsis sp. CCALA 051 TaxID=869949 RepID=UPI001E4C841A